MLFSVYYCVRVVVSFFIGWHRLATADGKSFDEKHGRIASVMGYGFPVSGTDNAPQTFHIVRHILQQFHTHLVEVGHY